MKNNKSFTLIEILVVIAILAGFMALLVPNFMEVRVKSRDVRRKSDLKTIQKALELYSLNQNPQTYPTTIPSPCTAFTDSVLANVTYLQKVPQDPLTQCNTASTANYYYVQSDSSTYSLYACAENKYDPEAVSVEASVYSSWLTNTKSNCVSAKFYKLTQP